MISNRKKKSGGSLVFYCRVTKKVKLLNDDSSNISSAVAQNLRHCVYLRVIWLLNVWDIAHLNFSRLTKISVAILYFIL